MPRDLTPIEQRPTRNLEMRFDRLCSNHLVADAIEAFQIMQELSRRQMIAQRSVPANEGTLSGHPLGSVEDIEAHRRAGTQLPKSPQPAAGDNTADAAATDNSGGPDGAAG